MPKTALVIGGGIAGCTIAAALAQRNIRVQVLESAQIASAGSGNDQGVLYTRLSTRHSPLSDFSLQSFLFATRFYRQLFSQGLLEEHRDGELCGSFHQSEKHREMETFQELLQTVPALAQVLTANQANEHLGAVQHKAGYWYPDSGWINPGAVCRAMLSHANIQFQENTGTVSLAQTDEGWSANNSQAIVARADCAIVAAGTASDRLAELDWLPLQAIRGQTTGLPASAGLAGLRAALCHKGYISPARNNTHCIGATFDIEDKNTQTRPTDHRKNLDTLAAALPDLQATLAQLDENKLAGRVGYRCASPDYLPLVGPVPQREKFLRDYAQLRNNARRTIATEGSYRPNLYLSTGHGSRGLTSTPLTAEILASWICGEPLPVSRELARALSPARFLIRDLKRKTI